MDTKSNPVLNAAKKDSRRVVLIDTPDERTWCSYIQAIDNPTVLELFHPWRFGPTTYTNEYDTYDNHYTPMYSPPHPRIENKVASAPRNSEETKSHKFSSVCPLCKADLSFGAEPGEQSDTECICPGCDVTIRAGRRALHLENVYKRAARAYTDIEKTFMHMSGLEEKYGNMRSVEHTMRTTHPGFKWTDTMDAFTRYDDVAVRMGWESILMPEMLP